MNLNPTFIQNEETKIKSFLIWILPLILVFYLLFFIIDYRINTTRVIVGIPLSLGGLSSSGRDTGGLLFTAGRYTFLKESRFRHYCLGSTNFESEYEICYGLSFESARTLYEYFNQLNQ